MPHSALSSLLESQKMKPKSFWEEFNESSESQASCEGPDMGSKEASMTA